MDYSMDFTDKSTEDDFMEELDYMEFNFDAPAPCMNRPVRPPHPAEDIEIYNLKVNAEDHKQRVMTIMQEVEEFEQQSKNHNRQINVSKLKKEAASELRKFNKILDSVTPEPRAVDWISCSNLPYLESLWSIAKTCEGITHFRRHVCYNLKHHRENPKYTPPNGGHITNASYIDIIAQNGLDWIKVSRITEDRLLREIFKSGWNEDSNDEDDEDIENEKSDYKMGLLKSMTSIVKASLHERVRCRNPTVRLVLLNIPKDAPQPIMEVIDKIRRLGVAIYTEDLFPSSPLPLSRTILDRMTAEQFNTFTPQLNIDTSILVALASDISNRQLAPQSWHIRQTSDQIKAEADEKILTRRVWPACGPRELLCTREVADKIQEISSIIGTAEEKARTTLLLGTGGLTQEESVREFQKLSSYLVPTDWQIPLRIIDVDIPAMRAWIPSVMDEVLDNLMEMNLSAFLFGWTTGLTTLSSNGVVIKAIEQVVEKTNMEEPSFGYPDTWHCPSTRSLVGVEREHQLGSTTQRRALRHR